MINFKFEDDRYTLHIQERQIDTAVDRWDIDADPEQLQVYRAEDARVGATLGQSVRFATATRVYVGGYKMDADQPDDADQAAWDLYNAAELAIFATALRDLAPAIESAGVTPVDPDRLVASHWAGCTVCKCSGGVLTDPARPVTGGYPVDIRVTVK